MSSTSDFYLVQAAQNALAAAESNLPNVRARCLRAEAAWRAMADRIERTLATRQASEAAKASLELDR